MNNRRLLTLTLLAASLAGGLAQADSKRIVVYELSQPYVDVRPGDTLGKIAASLLPHNPGLRQQLMIDIMNMNPDVFPGNRAERMLAGERLHLPNSMLQADSDPDDRTHTVETFSWGNIKRPR